MFTVFNTAIALLLVTTADYTTVDAAGDDVEKSKVNSIRVRNLQIKSGKFGKILKNDKAGKSGKADSERPSVAKSLKNDKAGKSGKSDKSNTTDGGRPEGHSVEKVRTYLRKFVDSLEEGLQTDRGYHVNAANQVQDFHTCTIVQECLDPDFILSLGIMSGKSRGLVYNAMSKVMSEESFNMLQLQQHSNMLLGEMQDWANSCPGECRELLDPRGLLEPIVEIDIDKQSNLVPYVSYNQCGNLRQNGTKTLWYCKDEPRMIHQANIDVATGKYELGDIWNEPHIHGRNSWYDYFTVYGDINENGGAFGLRFSGHHIDLNFRWNDKGEMISDTPIFLGHNPLIVPGTTPPLNREHNEQVHASQFYTPLIWANMAGIAQFSESVDLLLDVSNILLDTAPDSFVPLSNWFSQGAYGALIPADGKQAIDFDYYDLSKASESEFEPFWNLIEYTLKFARGHRSTQIEHNMFRNEGKVIWTTTGSPKKNLPFTEDDMRSNMSFLNLRIETDDYLFFVMVNELFCVISEVEPTNHLHSIYVKKALLNSDNACIDASSKEKGAVCESKKVNDFEDPNIELLSGPFKYETSMWTERNLKGKISLNIEAFDKAVTAVSNARCGLGMTATLFNEKSVQVYQKDVGTVYTPIVDGGYNQIDGYGPLVEGWTGDTTATVWSNIKVIAAATYLAAVVDTGLGYLDEPIYLTFDEYLTKDDKAGQITPRMILSHTTGLKEPIRDDVNDPYYACKYDETTTLSECLSKYISDKNLIDDPGYKQLYNSQAFDILAELAVRKTGIGSYGQIFQQYITGPLEMDSTTYDCPVTKSTSEKPHVAWGSCTTGNDFPKFVQILSNSGMKLDRTQILSKYAVTQILSHGGGNAINDGDWIFGSFYSLPFTRCYSRMYNLPEELGVSAPPPATMPMNSISGYGLGAMFGLGNYGEIFFHYGSTGGVWFVAPGRFSGYILWMTSLSVPGAKENGNPYIYIADIINALEEGSDFAVSKSNVIKDSWEEVEMCGGHDMYVDFFSKLGISSMKQFSPPSKTCVEE